MRRSISQRSSLSRSLACPVQTRVSLWVLQPSQKADWRLAFCLPQVVAKLTVAEEEPAPAKPGHSSSVSFLFIFRVVLDHIALGCLSNVLTVAKVSPPLRSPPPRKKAESDWIELLDEVSAHACSSWASSRLLLAFLALLYHSLLILHQWMRWFCAFCF